MREAKHRNFSRESKLANCSGRRSAEGRDTCLAHWPQTLHECELELEGLLLHPVPFRNFRWDAAKRLHSPAEGDNPVGRLICPGAGKESEANRVRLNYYCRLHILSDTDGILKINSRTVTKLSPFISYSYRRLNVGQISPRNVCHRNIKSGDGMGAKGP